jgi:hypothetical protein
LQGRLIPQRHMQPIKLFVGHDAREAVGLHVFLESLWKHTSKPVDLTVLTPRLCENLGRDAGATNSFGTTRFAIPHLMGYSGWAIWCDGADQLLRADLAELWAMCDGTEAIKVVKHDYRTQHPRKYVGTMMEADNQDYPKKNQSSVMCINAGHWAHFRAREKLLSGDGKYLHRFSWLEDEEIGEIPKEWNHLVGEVEPNPKAKLVHYTLGIPGFEHYRHSEHAVEWQMTLKDAARGIQYLGR